MNKLKIEITGNDAITAILRQSCGTVLQKKLGRKTVGSLAEIISKAIIMEIGK